MSSNFLRVDSARIGTINNVTVTTATSAASAAFGSQTWQIRIAATGACNYKIDYGSPTAAATDALLPQNWVEYVKVSPSQKIAVFNPGATMTVSVVEINE